VSIRIEISSNRRKSKIRSLIGGIICLILSVLGFYIAFAGQAFGGGVPFIPDGLNQGIGRIMIGIGALFTGILAFVAFREIFIPVKKK
jgi:polyferredoxin